MGWWCIRILRFAFGARRSFFCFCFFWKPRLYGVFFCFFLFFCFDSFFFDAFFFFRFRFFFFLVLLDFVARSLAEEKIVRAIRRRTNKNNNKRKKRVIVYNVSRPRPGLMLYVTFSLTYPSPAVPRLCRLVSFVTYPPPTPNPSAPVRRLASLLTLSLYNLRNVPLCTLVFFWFLFLIFGF